MHATQALAIDARATLTVALADLQAASDALPFPADYDTNDDAAAAYEDAIGAAAARVGLHQARAAALAAEDALLDWAIGTVAAEAAFKPIAADIDRARVHLRYREQLIGIALRLEA
jgi:hypothetical protein